MYLLIIFLPLISSLSCLLFSRLLGKTGIFIISTSCIGLSLFFTSISFYEIILCHCNCYIQLFDWINIYNIQIKWGFLFDGITASMLFIILFISFLVHCYSIEYMKEDAHIKRFFGYLSLSTFFTIILVTADNFLQMLLGWEGVGLASYSLINFWYTRIKANKAALKAVFINKIGDIGIIITISFLLIYYKTINYNTLFSIIYLFTNDNIILYNFNLLNIIGFFLVIGVIGKSAQIGLHIWLADAMEGPTPVSALIHAATMVTAGVYLLIRCSPILEYTSNILLFITIIGGTTAFFSSILGLFQYDIKKIIAYSTCSQLGYMIFTCGQSNYFVGLFHSINHAFFKALLFSAAGSIIHAMSNEQDIRRYGGLINILPISYISLFIGSLALTGSPFLTGYYSKDIIFEISLGGFYINLIYLQWLGIISAFFTSFYSTRLLYYTFFTKPNNSQIIYITIHQNGFWINSVLIISTIFSIFWGYLTQEIFIGISNDFTNNGIFILPTHYSKILDSEFLNVYHKNIPIIFSIGSMLFCSYFHENIENFWKNYIIKFKWFLNIIYYNFNLKKWIFDLFINKLFIFYNLKYSFFLWKFIDKGLYEKIGNHGIVFYYRKLIKKINQFHDGFIDNYISILLSSFLSLIILFFYSITTIIVIFLLLSLIFLTKKI